MTDFQCTKCSYRFAKDRKPLNCPYCGKAGTVEEVPEASDILADIDLHERRMQEIESMKKEMKRGY